MARSSPVRGRHDDGTGRCLVRRDGRAQFRWRGLQPEVDAELEVLAEPRRFQVLEILDDLAAPSFSTTLLPYSRAAVR